MRLDRIPATPQARRPAIELRRLISLVEIQSGRLPQRSLLRTLALLRAALEELDATDEVPSLDSLEIAATD